ncbi:MAG TPA: N-acetylmuramoyl-L-alanine amidase [Vicinamibacterales bacterium]|nr:N-acetylmuramoyl-L-alanine amidase [Vicinamibacterales bacterium]
MTFKSRTALFLAAVIFASASAADAQTVRDLYTRALARDRAVRDAAQAATRQQIRGAIAAYERVVLRYPKSSYCDNALWQASELSRMAWDKFGDDADRRNGVRLLKLLKAGYSSSPLTRDADEALAQFETVKTAPATSTVARNTASAPAVAPAARGNADAAPNERPSLGTGIVRGITRTALPDGVRVSIEVDREIYFRQEKLENPKRLFFDLRGTGTNAELRDKTLTFTDDIVKEIRLGRHPQNTTRVVLDTEGVESYSVFTLYNPYRVIVDFRRHGAPAAPPVALSPPIPAVVPTTGLSRMAGKPVSVPPPPAPLATVTPPPVKESLPSRDLGTPMLPPPTVPLANSNGAYSLARQLGLGISRVVLDPGHGGHDPGVNGNGINESELVLDVSLRLKKLLEKTPGIEVVLTRETDVFIPLEQRTAIANREGADLFLSIHANASRNTKASGIETYFLNFAANPEAEAVAARENSASGQTMHRLPDIVRAIALNNKIDESRDFASTIQKSMVKNLSGRNRDLQDRGVKQAPFVVLIGAGMPSVLAEISFVTNKQEGQLLKTQAYRQQIAEALFDAVVKYQRSLKTRATIAARED